MNSSLKSRGKNNYLKGVLAEENAMNFLKSKGFTIISNRYKGLYGEVDIIATIEKLVIFVEVKARKYGFENVLTQKQQERIAISAEIFMDAHPEYKDYDIRLDAIFITGSSLEHIENISI